MRSSVQVTARSAGTTEPVPKAAVQRQAVTHRRGLGTPPLTNPTFKDKFPTSLKGGRECGHTRLDEELASAENLQKRIFPGLGLDLNWLYA